VRRGAADLANGTRMADDPRQEAAQRYPERDRGAVPSSATETRRTSRAWTDGESCSDGRVEDDAKRGSRRSGDGASTPRSSVRRDQTRPPTPVDGRARRTNKPRVAFSPNSRAVSMRGKIPEELVRLATGGPTSRPGCVSEVQPEGFRQKRGSPGSPSGLARECGFGGFR